MTWVHLISSDADIKVLCSRDIVGIRAKEDFFAYHNVSLELLQLPNATCLTLKTTINNVTYYALRIPKERYVTCGGRPLEVELDKSSFEKVPSLTLIFSSTEKLDSHHILSQPHVQPPGQREYNQESSDQTGLQMCLSICQESQPAVCNHPVLHVSKTRLHETLT